MSKYLKKFETQAAYEAAQSGLILPNVSLTVDNNTVHYNPSTPTPVETRIIATFNVTSTTESTQIINGTRLTEFTSIEIDGVEQPSVVSAYTFTTTGEHTVKYTLTGQTTIYWATFSDCVDMINVIIPNNITGIGESAFYDCGLTSATIPNSVTYLGHQSFRSCKSLTSVGKVGSGASVEIPTSVTNIDSRAFAYSSGITSVVIPDSVTNIGYQAFMYCNGLTSVTIEATTPPTLGTNVFYDTNDCPIYVPSASVETYKAASGWSDYASRIQAIG